MTTIYQVDAFTDTKFFGNPAGVVLDADGLTETQMQLIARELNNSETAFVLKPEADDHDVRIRYFTPNTEVPLCGHATIAAHFMRAAVLDLPSGTLLQKTGAGILPVHIERSPTGHLITMTQGEINIEPPFSAGTTSRVMEALGIRESDLAPNCPVQIVGAGHSKIILGIRTRSTLNRLTPDFNSLIKISNDVGSNGYFVFTFDSLAPDILTCARMFAPAIGINEDPVTGNGPLGAYLVHNNLVEHSIDRFSFKGLQGEAMGRPGTVLVDVDIDNNSPVRTHVSGQAVLVFKAEVDISS